MANAVRIENVSASEEDKVVVESWDTDTTGKDVMIRRTILGFPTAITQLSLYNWRHLVIRKLNETKE